MHVKVGLCLLALLAGSAWAAPSEAAQAGAQYQAQVSQLPLERPPLWPFRTYSDASSWSCTQNSNHVVTLEVRHAEVPGVTAGQFRWLYNGGLLASTVVDGKRWPNYLLYHPRDHGGLAITKLPLKAKDSAYVLNDFPLTGCRATGDAAAPYACPSGADARNPGYVAGRAGEAAAAKAERINSTAVVLDQTPSTLEFGVEGCNEEGRCAWVVKTVHTFKETSKGLVLATRQQFGLDMIAARGVNKRIIASWAGDEDPLKKCARGALHFIEETGATQYWLPQAFAQGQRK